jgi:pimeloyl-ACP methyl ester carboxylesterase
MARFISLLLISILAAGLTGCRTLEELPSPTEEQYARITSAQTIEVHGLSIHYRVDDPDATGTPILLLHGFMSNLHSWDYLTPLLNTGGPLISYDRAAFGLTQRLADPGEDFYSTEQTIERAAALLDALGKDQVIIMGHSAGGRLAVDMALSYPDRVQAVILIAPALKNSGPGPLTRFFLRIRWLEGMYLRIIRNQLTSDPMDLFSRAWYDPESIPPELIDHYTLPLYIENWDKALLDYSITSQQKDITQRLKEITIPILIIHGAQDEIVPVTDSTEAVKLCSQGQLHILEDCGHVPHEECPEESARLVTQFLHTLNLN